MHFQLPNEIVKLQSELRAFFSEKIKPIADTRDHQGPLSRKELQGLFKTLEPSGYMKAALPVALGGDARTILERTIFGEEAALVWPALGTTVDTHMGVAASIFRGCPEFMIEKYLPSVMDGSIIFCDMTSEPEAGSDTRNLQTTAILQGDHYVVNGEKIWQTNGPWADVGVLTAISDPDAHDKNPKEGVVQLLVDKSQSKWKVRDIPFMGLRAGMTGHFEFDEMLVPKENLLFEGSKGYAENMKLRGWARVSTAAKTLGIMQAALDDAMEFAGRRVTFGKPLAAHQLIQNMIAEMAIDLDASRLLTYRAADMMDQGIRCDKEQAMCKAFSTEAAKRVTDNAIQILGARGLTLNEGYRTERLYRDARVYSIAEGTTQILKLIIARQILGIQAFS